VIAAVTLEAISRAWAVLGPRWEAYALVLPGDPAFICQPATCDAHCCRAFSVSLGAPEVARMAAASGLPPSRFLECEDGEPVTLPLVQPYLLARDGNGCALLGGDLGCTQYAGRPSACRLYPHFAVAFDLAAGRPLRSAGSTLPALVDAALAGEPPGPAVPLLLRHTECPGFTGPPLGEAAWAALFRETAALQSAVDSPPAGA